MNPKKLLGCFLLFTSIGWFGNAGIILFTDDSPSEFLVVMAFIFAGCYLVTLGLGELNDKS